MQRRKATVTLSVAAIILHKWLIIPAVLVATGYWLRTCLSDIYNVLFVPGWNQRQRYRSAHLGYPAYVADFACPLI